MSEAAVHRPDERYIYPIHPRLPVLILLRERLHSTQSAFSFAMVTIRLNLLALTVLAAAAATSARPYVDWGCKRIA